MVYINYIDDETHGRIWFEITLRNLDAVNNSLEQNIIFGPMCELVGRDYMVAVGGGSPQEAIESLKKTIAMHTTLGRPLDKKSDYPDQSWWSRMRCWWMLRGWRRDGTLNPVTWEAVKLLD